MMNILRRINLACLFFLLLFPLASEKLFADEFHYNNLTIGERPSGMAGAYTAISDDPSGVYYNPAGIAYSVEGSLSGSVNAFYRSNKSYKDAVKPHSWERESSSLLPNFFGIIMPVGKGVLGLSYAVPDSIVEDQDQQFSDFLYEIAGVNIAHYVINFNKEDNTYEFGPSYAQRVTDSISVGITLYYHQRRIQRVSNFVSVLPDNSHAWSNTYVEISEAALRPTLGVMWSPEDMKYSFGFTISKAMPLGSSYDQQNTTHDGTKLVRLTASSSDQRKYPLNLKLGVAYYPTHSLLFSADISHYTGTGQVKDSSPGLSYYDSSLGNLNITGSVMLYDKRESVTNIAFGTEYYFSSKSAVRGGFFTNFANTKSISSSDSGKDEHLDLYGLALSYTTFTRASSLTFGGVYTFGNGDAQVNGDDPTAIQSTSFSSLLIYLGTSYSF